MPNPKLETYKNKATGDVYDFTDAAAQAALAGILDGTDIDSFGDVETVLATKVDKVTGKGLSTNDYDNTEKAKVAGAFPRSEQAVLGAKNIMPYPYVSKTITENNVTFTLNDDGSVTVNTGSGGASGTTVFYLCQNYYIKKGNYILSGCPEGGSLGTYFLQFRRSGDPAIDARDIGNGVNVNIEQNNHFINYIGIVLLTGVELNNKTFKPMLRLATDTDDTFVSPAKTNKELTEKVQGIINAATNAADFAAFKTAIGNL